jgi:hypothetical protein
VPPTAACGAPARAFNLSSCFVAWFKCIKRLLSGATAASDRNCSRCHVHRLFEPEFSDEQEHVSVPSGAVKGLK